MTTIQEEKQRLRDNFEKGTRCACCNQNVKLYPRSISNTVAMALIIFAREYDKQEELYIEIKKVMGKAGVLNYFRGGDYAKLTCWGLIEAETGTTREDGNPRTGFYRLTDEGRAFAEGVITLPKYAMTYNGKVYKFKGKQVTITDCLGTKFNYNELMYGHLD